MNVHFATDEEISRWDELLVANPDGGNTFQARELAETKHLNGWRARYVLADTLAITILEKSIPILGAYWYLPKGPGVTSTDTLAVLIPALQRFAEDNGVFCIKIEPEILESDEATAALRPLGLIHTHPVQPNVSTVLVDLTPPLDNIMANLNQKGRHAIHRAERDGVTARAVDLTPDNARIMYDLLTKTAAGRFEASVRSFDYYSTFWHAYVDKGLGSLFFAYFEGKVVAAAFCMHLGANGLYKDGASIRDRTAYGASHLLQWEVIKWMKDRGVTRYDLCGTPHSTAMNDESHKFYGVGRFKSSFNKHITDFVGCYDLPVNPTSYKIWHRIGERVALSLTWRLKHTQWF